MAARVQGIVNARLVITPHRRGDDTAETQHAKAREATTEIAQLLLTES